MVRMLPLGMALNYLHMRNIWFDYMAAASSIYLQLNRMRSMQDSAANTCGIHLVNFPMGLMMKMIASYYIMLKKIESRKLYTIINTKNGSRSF
jgi:hypothetical protein